MRRLPRLRPRPSLAPQPLSARGLRQSSRNEVQVQHKTRPIARALLQFDLPPEHSGDDVVHDVQTQAAAALARRVVKNGSNTRRTSSAGAPQPSSSSVSSTRSPRLRAAMRIRPLVQIANACTRLFAPDWRSPAPEGQGNRKSPPDRWRVYDLHRATFDRSAARSAKFRAPAHSGQIRAAAR